MAAMTSLANDLLGDRITFHVSNIIVELRKLIQMIIETNFLCWRSNFKNSCFGFHQVSKRSKTIKTVGLRPLGFNCFLVFGNLMRPSHSFLKQYVTLAKFSHIWKNEGHHWKKRGYTCRNGSLWGIKIRFALAWTSCDQQF